MCGDGGSDGWGINHGVFLRGGDHRSRVAQVIEEQIAPAYMWNVHGMLNRIGSAENRADEVIDIDEVISIPWGQSSKNFIERRRCGCVDGNAISALTRIGRKPSDLLRIYAKARCQHVR